MDILHSVTSDYMKAFGSIAMACRSFSTIQSLGMELDFFSMSKLCCQRTHARSFSLLNFHHETHRVSGMAGLRIANETENQPYVMYSNVIHCLCAVGPFKCCTVITTSIFSSFSSSITNFRTSAIVEFINRLAMYLSSHIRIRCVLRSGHMSDWVSG